MTDNIYKILTNSADYMCLSCGTYNCNDGICDRCGAMQFGSPRHRARVDSQRAQDEELCLRNELGPDGYRELLRSRERMARVDALRTVKNLQDRERFEQRKRAQEAVERAALMAKLRIACCAAGVVALLAGIWYFASIQVALAATGGAWSASNICKNVTGRKGSNCPGREATQPAPAAEPHLASSPASRPNAMMKGIDMKCGVESRYGTMYP